MYELTIGNETYQIPQVSGQKAIFTQIDFLAFEFFKTKDEKLKHKFFTKLVEVAKPLTTGASRYFMKNLQDSKELEAILIADLWRLLHKWRPRKEYIAQYKTGKIKDSCKFHHLMLRQLRNQSINEVQRLQKPQENKRFVDLNSSVSIDDLTSFLSTTVPSPLDNLIRQDFIEKLINRVDDKTTKILKMVLNGEPLDEIRKAVGHKATPAIKRRQEACRPIVIELLTDSFSGFMNKLFEVVTDDCERVVISKYCSGETVEEISKRSQLHSSEIRSIVNKHRSTIFNMLM